jgi:hypothetical protein
MAGSPAAILDTLTPTFTPELPTLSPTVTLTPIPLFTSTSMLPLISVSVATNCRAGPGIVYDRVGALLVGEVAEVLGRNDTANYWYIRNPNQSNGFCWLWGEYATLTGNFAALPVFTPPPTPTPMPAFDGFYDGLESCNGWRPDFEVVNTGGITFESITIVVRDTDANFEASLSSDLFDNIDGCSGISTRERLNPGDSRIVSGPIFTYNPTGNELRATITLCSRDGLSGTCITDSFRFTP